jgi:DNA mismatch repair protein MSH5
LNVVYFPQLGFLVTIPLSEDLTLEKLSIIDDLRLQFATGKFAYFKNSKMIEMDNNIGDVHSQIVDIEVEMILALQKEMVLLEQEILLFAEKCYELDWYCCFYVSNRHIFEV